MNIFNNMESNVEYIISNDTLHAKYKNLYLINNKFFFLTTQKNVILKKVRLFGGPLISKTINYLMDLEVKYFSDETKLANFINSFNYESSHHIV